MTKHCRFGFPVALRACNAAEARGQQPAEGELQEGDILPEEADSHQGEQTAVTGCLSGGSEMADSFMDGYVIGMAAHSSSIEGQHHVEGVGSYVIHNYRRDQRDAPFSFRFVWKFFMVNYGDSGGWYPQHGTAVEKFSSTLCSLIVVVSFG